MRLAVDVRCLQDKYWTGVASYTWNNIKHLARHNDIEQVFYSNSHKSHQLPKALSTYGKVVERHFPNKLQDLSWRLNIWPTLDKLMGPANTPDWLWLPNPNFFRVSQRIKTAVTIHDLSFIHFPEFFSAKTRLWYLSYVKGLLKKQLNDLDLIIAVSENTRRDMIDLYPEAAAKVRVVYPAVEEIFFNRAKDEELKTLHEKYKLPGRYLLSVGTLEPRKNHMLLLKMYEELVARHKDWDVDLVIAGPYGWKAKNLFTYWRQLSCCERIHFLPFLPRELQPALYQQASLFLYPSFYEGFGFPVVEAMASRTPCLVANVSSLPELVGDSAVLLSPWNSSEWVNAVYNLYGNLSSYQDKIDLAFKRARQFNWPVSVDKLYNLFSTL